MIGGVEWRRVWLVRLTDMVIAGQVVDLHYNSFEISNVRWKIVIMHSVLLARKL